MQQEELLQIIDKAVAGYKGDVRVLESAIGALIVGHHFGWKPLFIINSQLTIRRYQKILGVQFREVLPDEGPLVHKSLGYAVVKQIGRFWDSVRGTAPGRSAEVT